MSNTDWCWKNEQHLNNILEHWPPKCLKVTVNVGIQTIVYIFKASRSFVNIFIWLLWNGLAYKKDWVKLTIKFLDGIMIDRIRLSITVFFLKITRIGIIKRPDRDKTVTTILQLYHDDTGIILVPILDVLVIPDDTNLY
jgi:hypothetical protein